MPTARTVEDILSDIQQVENHLEELRNELFTIASASQDAFGASRTSNRKGLDDEEEPKSVLSSTLQWNFPTSEYQRYARQMIVPEIGLRGQQQLRSSSVLIVGLGGLGCPAAKYLAGAGLRRIGLLDDDTVEVSNLHRQILHTTARVGLHKVISAARSLTETNDDVVIEPHPYHLTPQNALHLFEQYDLILDCTDHPTSRYLISDTAVIAGKPLVSASALKTDGQLIVLNNPSRLIHEAKGDASGDDSGEPAPTDSGPCYRCIFPKPPPPQSIVSCGEGGILGPVVGTMGVLQALEAIKILSKGIQNRVMEKPTLLIFSAYSNPQFRSLRMRPRRKDCAACGEAPTITRESLSSGSMDYVAFCGVASPVTVLSPDQRIEPEELVQRRNISDKTPPGFTLIDVRDKTQFELANIPGSINVPYKYFESGRIMNFHKRQEASNAVDEITGMIPNDGTDLLLICKLGNDSQLAAQRLIDLGYKQGDAWIGDVKGGLQAWKRNIEPNFPDI